MPLQTPTPDGVLELFRDEIVPREAEVDGEYQAVVSAQAGAAWANPFPGVETLAGRAGGPSLIRVSFRRRLDHGAFDSADRIRHDLRQLWNDIRAALPSEAQAEFIAPRMTHVDHSDGLEVICYTHGVVREA